MTERGAGIARKRALVLVAVVAVLAVAAWLAFAWTDGRAREAPLEASGTVEATDADLGFQAPGRIAAIHVREGDEVASGQELAALDRRELEAQVSAAGAQVTAAEARLRELRSGSRPEEIRSAEAEVSAAARQEEEARQEAERARRLHEGGAISRQALDRAETALEVAASHHRQAMEALELARQGPRAEVVQAQEAAVEQARAGLQRAETALEHGVVTAPFAGVVSGRHREPGETVGAGLPVVTLLDRSDRWVRIYLPGPALGRIRLGQPAEIRSDTWPDRSYEGRVVFIGSEAEFTPRNVQTPEERTRLVYPVKVAVTGDPAFELKPGMPADVRLVPDMPDAPEGEGR